MTLTDRIRQITGSITSYLGMTLHRAGVHPDALTVMGLILVMIAAVFIGQGQTQLGGLILVLGLPLDALDGAVARAMQRKDRFGAVLDSTLDRYADGFIFVGLSYYFAVQDRYEMMLLALLALLGSFLVSYVRARAEGIGLSLKEGLFTRFERVLIILIVLLIPIPNLLEIGVVVLAVGTNFTGLQRLWFVYRTLHQKEE